MQSLVFTIGHSNHALQQFLDLLSLHHITAVGDVRSTPYSRTNPQFNREQLKDALQERGIAYVFLGRELGARSEDPTCYRMGRVQYDLLARTELFHKGLERVREGSERFHLALMCAEREPLDCHRTILVARRLAKNGYNIQHIHADGHLEAHPEAVVRMVRTLKMPPPDMFRSEEDIVEEAYRRLEERIAYSKTAAVADAS